MTMALDYFYNKEGKALTSHLSIFDFTIQQIESSSYMLGTGGSDGKESACSAGDPGSIPGQEDPWTRKWQLTPVFLTGKRHGQRSLAGCSPCGRKNWTWLSN